MRTRFLLFLALLATPVAGIRLAGAANPITMELGSPLAVRDKPLAVQVRSGRWFPVAVTLTNTGDPVRATVSLGLIASGGQDTPTSEFYTEVDLPQNAHKRVWLYGRVESEDLDGAVINLRGRGISPLRTELQLSKVDTGTRIVLTISDSDEKLSYLGGLKGGFGAPDDAASNDQTPGMNAANQNQPMVRPVGTGHEMVPWKWIGLDAVDLLVLQDFSHSTLLPDQLKALQGYVASGGSMLVLGGSQWQRLAKSPLADLWPVAPDGSSVASAGEVADLVHNYVHSGTLNGADRLGGAPVLLTRGSVKPNGRLRLGSAAAPILTTCNIGAGEVLVLSLDPTQPPFLGWRGNAGLWAEIFNATSRPRRIESVDPNASLVAAGQPGYGGPGFSGRYQSPTGSEADDNSNPLLHLLHSLDVAQQLKTPPVSYIAWFLALYVFFLVPVNYCVLRFFDKRELAWVTVPVIVLVFSVVSYAAALSIKGRAVLTRHVNIVQGAADSDSARADTVLWLFSPRKTTYTIVSADPQVVVADYINGEENARVSIREPNGEPNEASAFRVENAAINMWDRRFFVGHSVISAGKGVHVTVSGGQPVIQNNTPFDLRGAVLVTGGQVRGYGDIKAGATTRHITSTDSVDLADGSMPGRITRAANLDTVFPATATNMTSQMAAAAVPMILGRNFGRSGTAGAMLIAWGNRPASALRAQGEAPQEQDITAFVFRLNNDALMTLTAAPGGQPAKSASKAVDAAVRPVSVESANANADTASGSLLTYNCELPGMANGATVAPLPWRAIKITVHGLNQDPEQAYNSYSQYQYRRYGRRGGSMSIPLRGTRHPKAYTVQFEIWDFADARWRPLMAVPDEPKTRGQGWRNQVLIPRHSTVGLNLANLLRRPDNLLRLRARTAHSGVQIDTVRVQGLMP